MKLQGTKMWSNVIVKMLSGVVQEYEGYLWVSCANGVIEVTKRYAPDADEPDDSGDLECTDLYNMLAIISVECA